MDRFSVHGLHPKGFLDGALFHDKLQCVREEKDYRQIELGGGDHRDKNRLFKSIQVDSIVVPLYKTREKRFVYVGVHLKGRVSLNFFILS